VLSKAQALVIASRLRRIRRRQASPVTDLERQYTYHLHEYVACKLKLRKIGNIDYVPLIMLWEGSSFHFRLEQSRDQHRQQMSMLEDEITGKSLEPYWERGYGKVWNEV
jgi:hypothetical protein